MALLLAGLMRGFDRDEVLAANWEPLAQLRRLEPLHPEVEEVASVTYDPIQSGEWVTIKLVVNGARVVVLINDEQVLNYVQARGQRPASPDAERLIRNGTIAIQGAGGTGRVFFKSIRIRKLAPA